MPTLVIVESPSKAKKIGAMLGPRYSVQATIGHIRDLPTAGEGNGYNETTLQPVYHLTERGRQQVKYLAAKLKVCDGVLLATDPDREGESIAWHVAEVLGIKARRRVKFQEITTDAIRRAVHGPAFLDDALVKAQEARRVIDRMVGWLVSGPLSRAIEERASAGRVQSPALGLVVARERAILDFVREQFFTVQVWFGEWSATWTVEGEGEQPCRDQDRARQVAALDSFVVTDFVERDEHEAPPAPFDTALLQQAASVSLGFDPEKTMELAQTLFEGFESGQGLITYHRTDDTNLSDEAFGMIQNLAARAGLQVVPTKRRFKTAQGAQEAHEAIRPTNFEADIRSLTPDLAALYRLIHTRAIASQMLDVVYSVRRVLLRSGEQNFKAVGRQMTEPGWRVLGEPAEMEEPEGEGAQDEKAESDHQIPVLTVGETLKATTAQIDTRWTRAPIRYTKASLIKTLKALGIGRPSTFVPSVDGLVKRGYVKLKARFLVPTEVACKIYDALNGHFSFIAVDYTRKLETDLDAIAKGVKRYSEVVRQVYETLHRELQLSGWSRGTLSVRAPEPDNELIEFLTGAVWAVQGSVDVSNLRSTVYTDGAHTAGPQLESVVTASKKGVKTAPPGTLWTS